MRHIDFSQYWCNENCIIKVQCIRDNLTYCEQNKHEKPMFGALQVTFCEELHPVRMPNGVGHFVKLSLYVGTIVFLMYLKLKYKVTYIKLLLMSVETWKVNISFYRYMWVVQINRTIIEVAKIFTCSIIIFELPCM